MSIFLHGIRDEALSLQLIMGTSVVLICWERVIVVFFNNLCVGKTLFGCDLQVVGKSEDIVLLLVYFFSLIVEMVACIRYEDRLDGMSNYLQWKVRMTAVFKENGLWTIVSTMVTPPASDPISLDIHEVRGQSPKIDFGWY